MRAQDLMTQKVRTVSLTTPVRKIAATMVAHGISAVPVVDRAHRVLGIVSEKDLMRRTEVGTQRHERWWSGLIDDPRDVARDYVKSAGAYARDVMSKPVISVAPTTTAGEIVDLMEKWSIKRVPVVRDGKLVGIISRRDLVRALSEQRPFSRKRKLTDKQLRERLQQQLTDQRWVASSFVNFVVRDGRVDLVGVVPSAAHAEAVRAFAESMEGVRSVKNDLTIYARRGD